MSRDAYAGGGAGGARIALHAELLPSLLPSEGAFSDVVDGLIQENFCHGVAGRQIFKALPKPTPMEEHTYT